MTTESTFRLAFGILLAALLAMRIYFMVKVRRAGGRLMPDKQAVAREGGRGVFVVRVIAFFMLMTFLVMYLIGAKWIDIFLFPLPAGLRWAGFVIGLVTVAFWTWVQVTLDTQWSAQLQLQKEHRLITTGPYSRIRHPLCVGMLGWSFSLLLLTANWIFVAVCALSAGGLLYRIPKEGR
jgi:protein-S-isoprenylcysteine O-methyltransferase Ste14